MLTTPLDWLIAGRYDLVLQSTDWLTEGPYGLGLFFAIGLLGGAHCLGMCGPLVTTYATRLKDGDRAGSERRSGSTPGSELRLDWRDVRQHALFNLGRTLAYATMGVVLGGLGAVLFDAAAVAAVGDVVRGIAGVLVGTVILAVGVRYLLGGVSDVGTIPGSVGIFQRLTDWMLSRIDTWVRGPRILALGAVHAVLPCPLLFPVYLYVFARGSPLEGGLALGALGLGTFPTLFALGTLWTEVSARTRGRLHRVLGALFLLLGLVALTHGLRLLGVPVPMIPIPVYQPLS